MLIDLNELRPQNETQEHFFLKQIGRAFLFKQGIRCIATEVEGLRTFDNPSFGTPKVVIDVLGIDKRNKRHEPSIRLNTKIQELALKIGKKRNLVEERKWGGPSFIHFYSMKDKDEKTRVELEIEACYEEACKKLGYHKDLYKKLRFYSQHVHEMRGIEVKVSYSDFKNGFNMLAEYSYVLAPKGIVPKSELPPKVGLLEFDFDLYHKFMEEGKEEPWFHALKTTKRPKKTYDSQFMDEKDKRHFFNRGRHAEFCEDLLFTIAQQNSEEHIFWNPHLHHVNKSYLSNFWSHLFSLEIGEKTPLGIVTDRRIGQYTYTNEEMKAMYPSGHYTSNKKEYRMDYYQFASSVGMSKWMAKIHVDKLIADKKKSLYERLNQISSLKESIELYMECREQGLEWLSAKRQQTNSFEELIESDDLSSVLSDVRIVFNEKSR